MFDEMTATVFLSWRLFSLAKNTVWSAKETFGAGQVFSIGITGHTNNFGLFLPLSDWQVFFSRLQSKKNLIRFYQPRNSIVMKNCRSKKEKVTVWAIVVYVSGDFQYFNQFLLILLLSIQSINFHFFQF